MIHRITTFVVIILVGIVALFGLHKIHRTVSFSTRNQNLQMWRIQSIDTMKYSRDIAREKLDDTQYDSEIEKEIIRIAQTGANYVSIGTPYDEEFLPYLRRWVRTARAHNLHVWFRGNFSGWEGWFGYPDISRDQHLLLTKEFIEKNGDLFVDGDIFTACTECENGGPGDPRLNGDPEGHSNFLISLHTTAAKAFNAQGKRVTTGYFPMNGDVARLIMTPETTKALGGVVVIDHYVDTPERLVSDIKRYASESQGKVILGEFGAPIPDIHGSLSEDQQAEWIDQALESIQKEESVIGINYWTARGGSTGLWTSAGDAKKAVEVVTKHYTPEVFETEIFDTAKSRIEGATITVGKRIFASESDGYVSFPLMASDQEITVEAQGYYSTTINLHDWDKKNVVILHKVNRTPWYIFKELLRAYI